MKGLVSLLVAAAIGLGIYMYSLQQAAPSSGTVITQNISLAGVKNDLVSIAQAERLYYTQNGSYADLPTLSSSGTMNITRTSRDGYTYVAAASGNGFTVTATYTPPPVSNPANVTPPHFPTFTIDQTMEVHQGD
ncbi:MAG TPA: type IV pilin protein [Candidatus Acidoferrales bacterium]|jgi:Tfp pilus assembly protein PilE|nr:type IV pilin protein [Candidatus Acidoferrales bacterium]